MDSAAIPWHGANSQTGLPEQEFSVGAGEQDLQARPLWKPSLLEPGMFGCVGWEYSCVHAEKSSACWWCRNMDEMSRTPMPASLPASPHLSPNKQHVRINWPLSTGANYFLLCCPEGHSGGPGIAGSGDWAQEPGAWVCSHSEWAGWWAGTGETRSQAILLLFKGKCYCL